MKILLTGKPRSGKTTLLHILVDGVAPKRGLVASEVRKDGERIGFDLLDDSGRTAALSRTDKPTKYPVGRYFVNLAPFNGGFAVAGFFIESVAPSVSSVLNHDQSS